MKIGIYGGSFNPIHFGHIGLAKWVVENTDLDELWLMVSPNNPLKDKSILADENERLEKAREAIRREGDEAMRRESKRIVVSDFEFHLPRPTYTANTLRALAGEYPEHEFTLIIGEDNLHIFNQWREYQYILDNYRVFVYPRRKGDEAMRREGDEEMRREGEKAMGREGEKAMGREGDGGMIYLAGAPYFDISSTEIRKNLHK